MRGFRFLIQKAYFDKGMGLTNYAKYLIAFFGMSSLNMKATMFIAVVYGIACYVIGRLWYKYNFVETENEINNLFNPFVQEMREKI